MDDSLPSEARTAVLEWFDSRGRALPFRASSDPYGVLVSEVMAQQTQISRVADKWAAFMDAFPSVRVLAVAPPADVLRAWRGLGYNRRALNLQRAARAIVADHNGMVPSALADLERLPGVGRYTARAVACLAFGRPVGAVDTNVRRVLQRVIAADEPMPPARLQSAADGAVPAERPADWTHALMDIGATVCRPTSPRCAECPLRPWCAFAAHGASLPARRRARDVQPFETTTRWVRGRIVDLLRDAPPGDWTRLDGQIGSHDVVAVEGAIAGLELDGLLERHRDDPQLLRLGR
ncbi:MAG TPA: A/G-specific adenine glycosylase [Candidatus Limnocylindria bacterium]